METPTPQSGSTPTPPAPSIESKVSPVQAPQPSTPSTPEVPPAPATTESVTLSRWEYETLLERLKSVEDKAAAPAPAAPQSQELLKALNEGFTNIAKAGKKEDEYAMRGLPKALSHNQIDLSDVLDQPATFFAYGLSTAIIDDVQNNQVLSTPYGRIMKFKNIYINTVPTTGYQRSKNVSMCTFITRSKKEAEFIRNHSKFGIKYFEDAGKVMNLDSGLADMIALQHNALARKTPHEIFDMARKNPDVGIETQDVSVLRRLLAQKMGKDAFERQQKPVSIQVSMQKGSESNGNSQLVDTSENRETTQPV